MPTAAIIPNITRNIPPITGSGMVMKTAPNLPKIPRRIIRIPVVWRTRRLPTWDRTGQREWSGSGSGECLCRGRNPVLCSDIHTSISTPKRSTLSTLTKELIVAPRYVLADPPCVQGPVQGPDVPLRKMVRFRWRDAAARAVIDPLTKTRRRTINVMTAWSLRYVNVGP